LKVVTYVQRLTWFLWTPEGPELVEGWTLDSGLFSVIASCYLCDAISRVTEGICNDLVASPEIASVRIRLAMTTAVIASCTLRDERRCRGAGRNQAYRL